MISDTYGTPVDFEKYYSYRGSPFYGLGLFQRDLYDDRTTTLRTLQDFDRARNTGRVLFESNPNAKGLINGLSSYVVGGGLNIKISGDSKRLAKTAQLIVDEFLAENECDEWFNEIFTRYHRDGEIFLRLFPTDIVSIRAIEPDFIRPPVAEDAESDWSFGIKSAPHDSQTPLFFCIRYDKGSEEEVVPEHFIVHLKANVSKNVKRGVSSFYCCADDLNGTAKLRWAAREGEKVRSAIAYIRQFTSTPASAVTSLQSTTSTGEIQRYDSNGNAYIVPVRKVEPGSVVDIPKNLEMKSGPETNNAGVDVLLNQSLYAVAAAFQCPSWLVSGHDEASSYASAMVSESPFIKNVLRQQNTMCGFWRRVINKVLSISAAQGKLPANSLSLLKVDVQAPAPEIRNTKEEIEADLLLVDAGIMSKHTLAVRSELDLEQEKMKMDENNENEDNDIVESKGV